MGSMRLWRHERRITPEPPGCRIRDVLTFEPRFGAPLVSRFVRVFFQHRHRRLARYLGGIG